MALPVEIGFRQLHKTKLFGSPAFQTVPAMVYHDGVIVPEVDLAWYLRKSSRCTI